MDPQALTLFNAIAAAGRTIYDIAQGTSKMEEKQQLMEVYDTLMNLKREAAELEDENHDLKAKLRFKSDDFDFKNPFWFDKRHPDRALCPKCFSKEIVAPVAAAPRSTDTGVVYRLCLACDAAFLEGEGSRNNRSSERSGGPQGWMGR